MSTASSHSKHLQNLNSLRSYIKKVDSNLSALAHSIGADLKSLDTSLNKGTPHAKKYLPRTPKSSASFEQMLFDGLLGKRTGSNSGGGYQTSSSQLWAQIASSITKSISRSL